MTLATELVCEGISVLVTVVYYLFIYYQHYYVSTPKDYNLQLYRVKVTNKVYQVAIDSFIQQLRTQHEQLNSIVAMYITFTYITLHFTFQQLTQRDPDADGQTDMHACKHSHIYTHTDTHAHTLTHAKFLCYIQLQHILMLCNQL